MEVLKYDENGEEEESFRTPDQEQSIGKSSMNAPSLKQQVFLPFTSFDQFFIDSQLLKSNV